MATTIEARTKSQDQEKERSKKIYQRISSLDWGFDISNDAPKEDGYSNLAELKEEIIQLCCRHKYNMSVEKKFQPYNVFVLGGSGIGKTHMSGMAVKFGRGRAINIPKYYDIMRSSENWTLVDDRMHVRNNDAGSGDRDFLLMDDVKKMGSEASVYMSEKLYTWIENRYFKWTIWTSNYTESQIAEVFGKQVLSRMHRNGNKVINMNPAIEDYNV